MAKLMKKRSIKAGLPPGSLIFVGDKRDGEAKVNVIDYD
jgi:magnesium transporter